MYFEMKLQEIHYNFVVAQPLLGKKYFTFIWRRTGLSNVQKKMLPNQSTVMIISPLHFTSAANV